MWNQAGRLGNISNKTRIETFPGTISSCFTPLEMLHRSVRRNLFNSFHKAIPSREDYFRYLIVFLFFILCQRVVPRRVFSFVVVVMTIFSCPSLPFGPLYALFGVEPKTSGMTNLKKFSESFYTHLMWHGMTRNFPMHEYGSMQVAPSGNTLVDTCADRLSKRPESEAILPKRPRNPPLVNISFRNCSIALPLRVFEFENSFCHLALHFALIVTQRIGNEDA